MSWVDEKLGIKAGVWYAGSGVPASTLGKSLDFYVIIGAVVDSGTVYHKIDGIWTEVGTLTGEGEGGVSMLLGNVVGPPDDNRVEAIDGDPEEAQVDVRAQTFVWTAPGSPTLSAEPESGALAFEHEGKRVLLASGSAPEFGNESVLVRMRGGMRYSARIINGDVAIDSGSKDTIGFVNASAARQITLPPASLGRTLFFPFVGPVGPTLKRLGSELINGQASNHTLTGDVNGGLAVAMSDGANWVAKTIRWVDPSGFAPMTRLINTTAPLTGGGSLASDLTLGIDTSGFVPPSRSISVTSPLTGGGDFSANRTIGLDTSGFLAPTRAVNTSPPLTGGGALTADLLLGLDTSGFLAPTRAVNTTAPLTGGGALTADRTLGISDATTSAVGVIQLAGNLGGTAAAPLAKGLTADAISIQNAGGTHKGVWTTTGLRIGDNTAPTRKLEVVGDGQFGSGLARVWVGSYPGFEDSYGALWLGNITPSTTNYAFFGDGANNTLFNAPSAAGHISFRFAHNNVGAELTAAGLRIATDGLGATERLEVVGNALVSGTSNAKVTAKNTNTASDMTTADPAFVAESSAASGNAIMLGMVNNVRRGGVRWDSVGYASYNAAGGSHFWYSGLGSASPLGNLSAAGLRIGDTTTATQKLDVVGTAVASGDFIANNGANGKARLAGLVGSPTTHGALYLGNVTPSATNHTLSGNGSTQTELSVGSGGVISLKVNGSSKLTLTDSAGQVNSLGSFSQNTQYTGGHLVTTRTVSTDYTVDASNKDYIIFVDATAGPVTITTGAVGTGRVVIIKRKAGTNSVTVMVGPLLDGQNKNITLQTDAGGSGIHPYVELSCDGTDWFITRHFSIVVSS